MTQARPGTDSWIIRTKLSPPHLPAGLIQRRQLLEEAIADRGCRLTIVHAPAGYGKTTFLKQWYEYHVRHYGAASWLSLDVEERKPSFFIRYLVAALKQAGVPCMSLDTLLGQRIDELPARSIAAPIIHTLAQFQRNLVLFFDDYQLASSTPVKELLRKLIVHLPGNVRLVLSSRIFPDLAVQHLCNQGCVREIAIADLRFSQDEVSSVIAERFDEVVLRRLWDRTEGWPIACRMIKMLIRNRLFDVKHIDAFSGRTTELARYITEQVFTSLTTPEQAMLMHTSIANRFTGDLANVLCGDLDCWAILETLVRQDLFLVPLDTEGTWYRYHQLFREYLYERLRRDDREHILGLHLVAADWFFEQGYVPEAVEHALKGQDQSKAARMVDSAGGWRLIYQGRLDWLAGVLARLDRNVIDSFPRLFIADLLLLVKRGKPHEARQRMNALHQGTNGFEQWSGTPLEQTIRIELELVRRVILDGYTDQPVSDTTLSFTRECLETVTQDDDLLRCLLHDALSSAYLDAGLLQQANQHIVQATRMYQDAGFYYGAVYIYYHRANLEMERARLHDARKELLKAKDLAREHLDTNTNIAANTSVYLADVAFMQSRIEEARQLMDASLADIEKHDSWFDLYARAYTTAAGVAYITRGLDRARAVLERARRIAAERNLSRLALLSNLMEVKLLLLAGHLKPASELADAIDLGRLARQRTGPDNRSVFIPERSAIVWSRLLLMQRKTDALPNLLQPLAATLQKQGRYRLLIEARLLLLRAFYALNDFESAASLLTSAVEIAMLEDYKRPFVDEGKIITGIYDRLHKYRSVKSGNRFHRAFMLEINRLVRQEACTNNKHVNLHGLTPKEFRVITEMAKGQTNKEIASSLYITEDTVKYRLKKLFKKWNVSSRDDAVRMARDKSLL